jgi:hypothetical protein
VIIFSGMKMQKSLLLLFTFLTSISHLFAQDAELKAPKPDFTFGANLILSNPLSDFGDTDVLNADAGFAKFGAGLGIFGHFEYKNGFFVEINADYTRRKSTVWSESVDILGEILNEQDPTQEIEFSVLRNPGFRHLSFLFGPGFNFKMKDVDIYLRGEFGLAFNRLTSSSIEDNNGSTSNFQASGEIVPAFGLGAGILIYNTLRFDFSVMNLGNPEFQWRLNDPSTEFSLPIQVFEIGIGLMIVK